MGIIIPVLTEKCSEETIRTCVETFHKQKCQTVIIFSKNNMYLKKIVKKRTNIIGAEGRREQHPGPKSIIPK